MDEGIEGRSEPTEVVEEPGYSPRLGAAGRADAAAMEHRVAAQRDHDEPRAFVPLTAESEALGAEQR